MPGLVQALEGHDLGHLRIVAECWGIDLQSTDKSVAIKQLCDLIPAKFAELDESNAAARTALADLVSAGGRLPWAQFTRQYGELREMGIARRDKELPHRHPISITENLWYRALIGRGFFDSPQGPMEFAYLPDEILALAPAAAASAVFGRPARPDERAFVIRANDRILDEACTLVAGLRLSMDDKQLEKAEAWQTQPRVLTSLLKMAKLVDPNALPSPKAARNFLQALRRRAFLLLAQSWMRSKEFNELRLMPGLITEGNWHNDPLAARQKVLEFARSAQPGQWWSIPSLIANVKKKNPDFQRSAGDYESWYLRNAENGEYLRGFEHWDEVDGALIAFILRGPMHWLGLVDLAAPAEGKLALAFRWTSWADALLTGNEPKGFKAESLKVKVDSRGVVSVPRLAPRAARYQLARFTDWLPQKGDVYQYQITAKSLQAARSQGLKVTHLVALLKAHSPTALPPNLLQALKRWEQSGSQASLGSMLVLRLQSAAALKALRASRAARYLGEPLGPNAVAVKAGASAQVLQVLVELGYLGEYVQEENK